MSLDSGPLSLASGVDFSNVHPALQQRIRLAAQIYNYYTGGRIVITSGFRSVAKQAELYAARGSNVNRFGEKLPVNKPGDSSHNWGLGVDTDISGSATPALRKFWTLCRVYVGLTVPANDWNHSEVPNWRRFAV